MCKNRTVFMDAVLSSHAIILFWGLFTKCLAILLVSFLVYLNFGTFFRLLAFQLSMNLCLLDSVIVAIFFDFFNFPHLFHYRPCQRRTIMAKNIASPLCCAILPRSFMV